MENFGSSREFQYNPFIHFNKSFRKAEDNKPSPTTSNSKKPSPSKSQQSLSQDLIQLIQNSSREQSKATFKSLTGSSFKKPLPKKSTGEESEDEPDDLLTDLEKVISFK
jgi:hypothetical protein